MGGDCFSPCPLPLCRSHIRASFWPEKHDFQPERKRPAARGHFGSAQIYHFGVSRTVLAYLLALLLEQSRPQNCDANHNYAT